MKKMLLVYPNNFLQGAQGTNSRVAQLVRAFRIIGFTIDYFGYKNFSPEINFENFEQLNKSENLISKLYLYDFATKTLSKGRPATERIKKKLTHVLKKKNQRQLYLQDWAPTEACTYIQELVYENEYEVIVLFYSYQANLLKALKTKAKKVYFMEDSMFLQQFSWGGQEQNDISLGKLLDEELERLEYFDKFFSISYDEKIMYEKFLGKKIKFLPHLMENKGVVQTEVSSRKWDVFFIGFDNPFNVEGINWFLREVYPYLKKDIRILIVGSVTKKLEITYSNVDTILYAPDLDEIFDRVKITICPMFKGTGMKIKVVESLAKGIPIVCNERGVDGFPDKTLCGCLVTQDPKKFGEYVNQLLYNSDFYNEVRSNGTKYYNEIFDRKKHLELLDQELS